MRTCSCCTVRSLLQELIAQWTITQSPGIALDCGLRSGFQHIDGPPVVGKIAQERSGDRAGCEVGVITNLAQI